MSVELVTYSCGHTGKVDIRGNARRRQYIVEQYAQHELCPECEKKRRDEENAKAARQNAEDGYPELTGTPKQIAWAESIRKEAFETMQEMIEDYQASGLDNVNKLRGYNKAFEDICGETSAAYFIDNRNNLISNFRFQAKEYQRDFDNGYAAEQEVPEVFGDAEDAVILNSKNGSVSMTYRKDEKFIAAAKKNGCRWHSGKWYRPISPGCASPADAAAALVDALVRDGFAVSVSDPIVKDMLKNGTWTPINPRELTYNDKYKSLELSGDDEVLELASKIPGARRLTGFVSAPESSSEIVRDFAESYGFALGSRAMEVIERVVGRERERAQIAENKPAETISANLASMRRGDDLSDLIDQSV